jgi:hypothetical protein
MTSEVRINSIKSKSGLGTVSVNDSGINVSGVVTATAFYGDGSNLTNLPTTGISSQFTTSGTWSKPSKGTFAYVTILDGGEDASWGGGGGGGANYNTLGGITDIFSAGRSFWGGGGGGAATGNPSIPGYNYSSRGTSINGGDGGDSGNDGSIPGGGGSGDYTGGSSGAGGDGACYVYVW